jgi:phage baseplate assembly protein gpV
MLKNPPKDLQIELEKLNGFWRGVVEDNVDPLKAGRVRVRIHGIHTPKKLKSDIEGIPTDELPWAEPCMPIHEGSISGFGAWAVPLQGSHVMLFFENSNPTQPRYFASMPGIPESKESYSNSGRLTSKNDGFKDPDGVYPTRLGEPDFHRLSRGVSNETLVVTKNQERDIGVPTALGGNWSEPVSPYAAQYPHNHVIATHGGITIELDSTPGSTRLHLYHPSNSFIEIDNDGNMVIKNNAERYEIITEGHNIHIKQQRNLTIDSSSKKRIVENEDIEVGGDKTEEVGNDITQNIGGNKTEDIEGNKIKNVDGNETDNIGGNKTEDIGGQLNITVIGNATITAPLITLNGNTNINGLLSTLGSGGVGGNMTGTFTIISGDLIADGISLKNHRHGGVESGGDITGLPQ